LEGASKNCIRAQAIERELIRRDPKTLEFQSDLAMICQKLGDILRSEDHIPEALDSYRECVSLTDKLVKDDPSNSEWATEFASACYSAATTSSKVGEKPNDEQRKLLETARDILVKLKTQNKLPPIGQDHLDEIEAALGAS
jgi:hypothetical protein